MNRGSIRVEPTEKRVRAYVDGILIFDSVHALLVWEAPPYPAYYIPVRDVQMDLLAATETVTHSPSRGDARHFTIKVGDDERVDAAWQYTESPLEEIREYLRFEWPALDAWFEEDEQVYVHTRNPYTRVDILPTSREVRVQIDGVELANSTHAHMLFETGLPARWYIPKVDVRMDLLMRTDGSSQCPYKGTAEYWSARVGDHLVENVAWSYRTPLPESERIAGLISFYNERVDLFIDGEQKQRPKTKFS